MNPKLLLAGMLAITSTTLPSMTPDLLDKKENLNLKDKAAEKRLRKQEKRLKELRKKLLNEPQVHYDKPGMVNSK